MIDVCSFPLTNSVRYPLPTLLAQFLKLKLSEELRGGREILPWLL